LIIINLSDTKRVKHTAYNKNNAGLRLQSETLLLHMLFFVPTF